MANKPDKSSPFYFEAYVDVSNLKAAASKAEKHYKHYDKAIAKVRKSLYKQTVDQQVSTKAIIASLEEQKDTWERVYSEVQKKRGKVADLSEKDAPWYSWTKRLEKEVAWYKTKFSNIWGKITDKWESFKDKFSLSGIIDTVKDAVTNYLEFDKTIRGLDSSIRQQPKLLRAAEEEITKLTGILDATREELAGVVSGISQLHLKLSPKELKGMIKETLYLSRALGVSTDSTMEFYQSWTRVYGLPHHKLRNIGASMKYIQEMTGISGSELTHFGKSLNDILARMTGLSKDAKGKVTADFMAIAGALTKIGIEPEKFASLFEESMKIGPSKFRSFLTAMTGVSDEAIRQMAKSGKAEEMLLLFHKALGKVGEENFDVWEENLTDITGFNRSALSNMLKLSGKDFSTYMAKSRKEYDKGILAAKRAADLQAPIIQKWQALKNMIDAFWRTIGKMVIDVAGKLAKIFIPWIQKGIVELNKWVSSKEAKKWFEDLGKSVVKTATWIIDGVKSIIKWWGTLTDSEKTTVKWAAGIALLAGQVGIVVTGLVTLYLTAKKIAEWIDSRQSKNIKAEGAGLALTKTLKSVAGQSESERVGFVRGEMIGTEAKAGRTLITPEGKINEGELRRRARDTQEATGIPGQVLVDKWRENLESIMKSTPITIKPTAAVTAPPPVAVPTAPKPVKDIAAMAGLTKEIVATADPNAVKTLENIFDLMQSTIARMGARSTHPGRVAVEQGG